MSKSKGKTSEKDSLSSSSSSLTMANISSLLTEHMDSLKAEFKQSFDSLSSKLDGIKSTITEHEERISSLEVFATGADQRIQQLEDLCASLQEANQAVMAKVTDLEGRSRRSNIRIIGLPEDIEGPRPSDFFSQLLVEVLGQDVLSSPPELDRAHRSLVPKPAPGAKPRPVILRFHRFQMKDLVIREARKKGVLSYRGHAIRFFEDYSPEVAKMRVTYRSSMAELYKRGYKPALLYPAILRIILLDGTRKWLSSPSVATKFIEDVNSCQD